MKVLLELKEQLKKIYGKFYVGLNAFLKFCLSLLVFGMLNSNLGFDARLKNPFLVFLLALMCTVMPYGIIAFFAAGFMLLHIYSVSFEIALITLILIVVIALLYYGFQPKDSLWLLLTPLAFLLRIPYVVPLLVGLTGSIVSIIPVSCGIIMYYVVLYVKQNAGVLTNDASVDITQKYVLIIKALLSNRAMLVMIVAFALGIVVVHLIRCMSVDYAWILAIVLGTAAQLVAIFVGDFMFDISVSTGSLLFGVFISVLVALAYHFFVFAVDYSRTEYLQYEDDDYVYYVKAVPKLTISASDVRVQRINPGKGQRSPERSRQQ